jgi:TRAP-type uncharacterized transport system fused permease subunit
MRPSDGDGRPSTRLRRAGQNLRAAPPGPFLTVAVLALLAGVLRVVRASLVGWHWADAVHLLVDLALAAVFLPLWRRQRQRVAGRSGKGA